MSSFDGFMIEEATKKSQRIRELEQQLSEAAARIRALESSLREIVSICDRGSVPKGQSFCATIWNIAAGVTDESKS